MSKLGRWVTEWLATYGHQKGYTEDNLPSMIEMYDIQREFKDKEQQDEQNKQRPRKRAKDNKTTDK